MTLNYSNKLLLILFVWLISTCPAQVVSGEDAFSKHHWIFAKEHLDQSSIQAVKGPAGEILGETFFAPGKQFSAIVLDGESNSIMISEQSTQVNLPTKQITAEAWVFINQDLEWGGIIGAVSDNGKDESGWILGYRNQHFYFGLATQDKQQLTYLTAKSEFELEKWYHVVGAYDGNVHQLFVNGQLAASDSSRSGAIFYPSTDTFYEIGAFHDSNEYFRLSGMLHEVSVSSHIMNQKQIAARYRAKLNKLPGKAIKPKKYHLAHSPYACYEPNGDVTLCWQTEIASPSIIRYGEPGQIDQVVNQARPQHKHRVTLTGLTPNQIYEYQISVRRNGQELQSHKHLFDTTFNHRPRPVPDELSPFGTNSTAKYYADAAKNILSKTGITKGYCIVYGIGEGLLAYELAKQSELIIVGVDTDADKVASVRQKMYAAKVYGTRITVRHVKSLEALPFTRDFANLIVSDDFITHGKLVGSPGETFRLLRPEGGTLFLGQPAANSKPIKKMDLHQWFKQTGLTFSLNEDKTGLWGTGKRDVVAGAGEWSHQYGDPGNASFGGETLGGISRASDLEVQWIGLPGADFGIDRQVRLSAPLAVNGRLFHQGMNRIIALDSYNGAFLWLLEIADLRRTNIPRDAANWCADQQNLFVAVNGECWVLNAYTGERMRVLQLPDHSRHQSHDWGYIANAGDMIFGSSVKRGSIYTDYWGRERWFDGTGSPGDGTDKVCSDDLFAYDKQTGQKAWNYQNGVILNTSIAVGDGRVYFVESRHPKVKTLVHGDARFLSAKDRRRGKTKGVAKEKLWLDQYMVALDARTGKKLWERPIDTTDGLVTFYLVYSDHKIVISASGGGEYHVYAFDAKNGEQQWHSIAPWSRNNHGAHAQHPAVVAGKVYQVPHVYDLESGSMVSNNMMGGNISRRCGSYVATEKSLIYRGNNLLSMWDMKNEQVSDWYRLRSSCWLSTIPAAGMLLSPEGGGGCSCGAWMETSLGFAPRVPIAKQNKN
ncbi:Outer membrane protein assembly factor BamB [Gimesia maris]|uniref:LamG-like jellyroll fold domain-containing protein n=1 Tax=Gimesia maris TaxID=122 RepID=UPI00118C6195|nr:LamG-like jellyroll fold domain-containing protein [Gimesia maris]QDT78542.1 Outer membrane protein assembly factor BamB [Gimesia maris]